MSMQILGSFPVRGMRLNPETPDVVTVLAGKGLGIGFAVTDIIPNPSPRAYCSKHFDDAASRRQAPATGCRVDDHESALRLPASCCDVWVSGSYGN
jgi:hypothetical protein